MGMIYQQREATWKAASPTTIWIFRLHHSKTQMGGSKAEEAQVLTSHRQESKSHSAPFDFSFQHVDDRLKSKGTSIN